MWFTLLSLQLGLLETICETQGRLTGAATRPAQRKTSWSLSGSDSPAEIWGGKKRETSSISDLAFVIPWSHTFHFGTLCYENHSHTVSSACPTQRKARSCLRWSRRFHSFGDPCFEETKTDHIVKTPRPANDCSCNVNKTLCGFTFRACVRIGWGWGGSAFQTFKSYSKWLRALQELPFWLLRHFILSLCWTVQWWWEICFPKLEKKHNWPKIRFLYINNVKLNDQPTSIDVINGLSAFTSIDFSLYDPWTSGQKHPMLYDLGTKWNVDVL